MVSRYPKKYVRFVPPPGDTPERGMENL